MVTVALYCRVSTDKQEADNQLIQLREYCAKCNMAIYKEYLDVISGKETFRPAYDQMFSDAHKMLFDMVLFWDLSRFSRAGTLHTLQKLHELDLLRIAWKSYQEPYFESVGAFKDVVISIMSTLAKIERERISEKTKAGLLRLKMSGTPINTRGKDRRKRKNNGYVLRWKNKAERILAQNRAVERRAKQGGSK